MLRSKGNRCASNVRSCRYFGDASCVRDCLHTRGNVHAAGSNSEQVENVLFSMVSLNLLHLAFLVQLGLQLPAAGKVSPLKTQAREGGRQQSGGWVGFAVSSHLHPLWSPWRGILADVGPGQAWQAAAGCRGLFKRGLPTRLGTQTRPKELLKAAQEATNRDFNKQFFQQQQSAV